jgi:hypothetical protein
VDLHHQFTGTVGALEWVDDVRKIYVPQGRHGQEDKNREEDCAGAHDFGQEIS